MPRKSRSRIVGKRAQREDEERRIALVRLSRQLRRSTRATIKPKKRST